MYQPFSGRLKNLMTSMAISTVTDLAKDDFKKASLHSFYPFTFLPLRLFDSWTLSPC
jgi:hypothetical protein